MTNSLSNAILVKIRAKYSKRLSPDDYKSLLSSDSVPSIASYLKNKESYRKYFSMINTEIHRDALENALLKGLLEDLSSLANYDLKFSKKIFKYILIHSEIQQISKFLTFLKSGNQKEFKCFLPEFLKSKSEVKFDKFNRVTTYRDLILSLKKTKYYNILKDSGDGDSFDINVIETSLYNYKFQFILDSIYKLKKILKENKKFFYKCIDIMNIIRVVRSKRVCTSSDQYILKIIFKFGDYKFDDYDIEERNLGDKFGRDVSSVGKLEKLLKKIKFEWAKKNIRYSNVSEIIGFSYILLKEIEIKNIINIIEGVRYKLPSDKIDQMLIK